MNTAADSSIATTSSPDIWAVRKLRMSLAANAPAESAELLDAVHDVNALELGNTTASKRSLSRVRQCRTVERSADVVTAFQAAQEALSSVRGTVREMEDNLESLSGRLPSVRASAAGVVVQTTDLRERVTKCAQRRVVTAAFVDRFVSGDEESNALKGDRIDASILKALGRVEGIHAQSRVLLQAQKQRVGLEALEMAATTREDAYEKVFQFVHNECGTLDVDTEEREEDVALLRNAILALRARPALLRPYPAEVGNARRASLVFRLVRALTKGGPGGVPRPIELHAHDPMRYANDMLAWIHQALASEKELIARFSASEPDVGDSTSEDAAREHNQALSLKVPTTIFDALCRPFRLRFEQSFLNASAVEVFESDLESIKCKVAVVAISK